MRQGGSTGPFEELARVIASVPPPTHGWTYELNELYERFEQDPDLPIPDGERERFEARRGRYLAKGRIHLLLRSLEQAVVRGTVRSSSDDAALVEECVRQGLDGWAAIDLLGALGVPHGEEALARLVVEESVSGFERCLAREELMRLRRPVYERLAARPLGENEEPLLPQVVRDFPYGTYGTYGIEGSDSPDPTPQFIAKAHAVLVALLPDAPLIWPEPPSEPEGLWHEDEEALPGWVETSIVFAGMMPHPRHVTRQRVIEGRHECVRLGIDVQDSEPDGFVTRWDTRIRAWIAEWTLSWLTRNLGRIGQVPAWAPELAALYIERNVAREQASALLSEAADMGGVPAAVRDMRGREVTAHHLLPRAMRELPSPWNDLTWQRERALEALAHTEENERAALGALTAALTVPPSVVRGVWSDESWEIFDRIRNDGRRLSQAMPTTDRLTREGVADVMRGWAASAAAPVPPWSLVEEQVDQVASACVSYTLSGWAHDVLRWLGREPRDEERIATVAERCVRHGLSPHEVVNMLYALGAPHGEQALLRVVRDDEVSEADRAWAREWLMRMRGPGYDARAQRPAHGEEPLLPPVVRELPYSWGAGFQWPPELPETEENFARARAILEACAPAGPVPEPVPHPAWDGDEDDERPVWLDIRSVMWSLMPYARLVTRERLTEAMRECALLGIPGVPWAPDSEQPDSEQVERFVQRWVTWIGGWIAGEVFTWLGMDVDDEDALVPWAMELAERYARNGVAAGQAVGMLSWWNTVPRSREALARIAGDRSLPPAVRESAADAL